MSVQTKITTRKSGKETKRYYATDYDSVAKKSLCGPLREKRSEALTDESKIRREMETQRKDGASSKVQSKTLTIAELYAAWQPHAQKALAAPTYKVYVGYYNKYIGPVFGDRKIASLTSDHFREYIRLLSQKYAPATVNKTINVLSNMSHFCQDEYKMALPLGTARRLSVPKKEKAVWTPTQIHAFLSFAKSSGSQYYPLLIVSALCAARPGEVCGMLQKEYRPDLCGISINSGYSKFKDKTSLKTAGSHRWLPLPPAAIEQIDKHIAWKDSMRANHPAFADNDFLFVSRFGAPITPDVYSKGFRRLLASYNDAFPEDPLPEIPLYNQRHSFATNILTGSEPAKVRDVAAIMGNSPRVMLECYAQVVQETNSAVISGYSDTVLKSV